MNPFAVIMEAVGARISRVARGPRACRALDRCGIDARRYWILMDLLDTISERGEMMDQLGRNGIALKTAAWLYGGMAILITIGLLIQQPGPGLYLSVFLALTGFLLTAILMSEAGNSLVNPVEALVLAHQPIDGATYTAAKLSHLLRIVFWLVAALDGVPAFAALFLQHAPWFYPALHLAAAFTVGLVAASVCCSVFGWLIRFVPAKRLKAVGHLVGTLPFLSAFIWQYLEIAFKRLGRRIPIPQSPGERWAIGIGLAAAAFVVIALGLRSLSADYLVRVSTMMHGRAKPGALRRRGRRSPVAGLVARFWGGAPARAGFAFTRVMMLRDFHFRRQILPMMLMIPVGFGPVLASQWRSDPFSPKFAAMHLLPHAIAIFLVMICALLPFGADYKGVWVFLLAPDRAMIRFVRGVWALLWIGAIAIPHALLLPLFVAVWGPLHAVLFIAYSLSAASLYLALELRLIEGVPFCKQFDAGRGLLSLPIVILGTMVVAIAVGLQYLLFHLAAAVAVVTVVLGFAAWVLTRLSLESFASSIRFHLGIVTTESTALYNEVNA